MITEIPIKDFKKADKKIKESWPLYVIWRHNNQTPLEAWGCDTKEEVQQKWEELTKKDGAVIVAEFRPGQSVPVSDGHGHIN